MAQCHTHDPGGEEESLQGADDPLRLGQPSGQNQAAHLPQDGAILPQAGETRRSPNTLRLRRTPKRFWLILSAWALLALAAAMLLVWHGLQESVGPADVGLVFGNRVERNGVPSRRLQARLDRALELSRQGYFPAVIVSGGLGKEGYDEAVVMRAYLVARGIPQDRVIADSNGFTTLATARNAKKILDERHWQSVLLVTQYFHVPRARWTLRRLGVPQVYSAHARHWELRDLYAVFRELAAVVRYRFLLPDGAKSQRCAASYGGWV